MMRRLEGRGVVLIGVNCDETPQQAKRTAAERGITWPQLWSPAEAEEGLVSRLCIRQWPSAVILGADGTLRAKFVGSVYQKPLVTADVERAVLEVLAGN